MRYTVSLLPFKVHADSADGARFEALQCLIESPDLFIVTENRRCTLEAGHGDIHQGGPVVTEFDVDAWVRELRQQTRDLRRAEADFREKLVAVTMQQRGCDRAEAERVVDDVAARLDAGIDA